jgi:uncharacterized membrane protein (UPF0127 family)
MLAPMRSVLLVMLLAVVSCGGNDGPNAIIDTGSRNVVVHVEIADSPAEQARGLMGRTRLASDSGMVFVFAQDTRAGFWMKDTLIPLSIAFYDRTGRIVRILDMTPCKQDPCRVYGPGVAYRGALEVERGAFARWGVHTGDLLRVER